MQDSPSRPSLSGERPLGPAERATLVATAAATILLFYILALVSGALIAVILAIVFTAMLGLARVGMSTLLRRPVRQHAQLLAILARSFWLGKESTYRIPLQRPDAPRLFSILDDLSKKFSVAAPHEVLLRFFGSLTSRNERTRRRWHARPGNGWVADRCLA